LKEGSRVQGFKGSKWLFIVAIAGTIVCLDYITKKTIETYVQPQEAIKILPFLRIVNTKNPGAAFGIFSNLSNDVFIFVSIVAILLLIIYVVRTAERLEILSISLILGGAVGNLIDRLTIAKVIDFIDFFIGRWHWPAFNVADSALTVGIIIFLWANVRHWCHRDKVESKG
jgi:signal peptidase II